MVSPGIYAGVIIIAVHRTPYSGQVYPPPNLHTQQITLA